MTKTIQRPVGRILCVDDDDDDASLLESAVSSLDDGIIFIKCYGGQEALALLNSASFVPNVILLDVNMPMLNGFECLREIKKNPTLKHVPVIMLSTSASARDVAFAMRLGALRFLTKPNSYHEIQKMMDEIIRECFINK